MTRMSSHAVDLENTCSWVLVGECFFWYWLSQVVPDKGPFSIYVCMCVCLEVLKFNFCMRSALQLVLYAILRPLYLTVPSVLWRCWLGSRKGIRSVKNWLVGCWRGYLSGARCRRIYGPADATATHCLASVKSRLVLPFWYRLTRIVWAIKQVCVCI